MHLKDPNRFSFAVLGDTHLTRAEWHPDLENADAGKQHDVTKYVANVENTVKPILRAIAESGAEFIVHSGDLVEGVDAPNERDEMLWALEVMASAGILCVYARGNHDGRRAYADVMRPANAQILQKPLSSDNFCFGMGNSLFVFVDSEFTGYNEAGAWLNYTLGSAWDYQHVFLIAHSPCWNTARPFFRDRHFSQLLPFMTRRLGIDALFCGHTHNQSISLHRTGGINRALQVKTCAVGWGEQRFLPLDRVKTWLLSEESLAWSWPGYLENSAPGWCLVEVDGEEVTLRWRDVAGEDHVLLRWRERGVVEEVWRRELPPVIPPTEDELGSALRGWLCLSVYAPGSVKKQVMLGSTLLGEFPTTVPYYHHRTELSTEALRRLQPANRVCLIAPSADRFCVGSLMIEVLLSDGRIVRTAPGPLIYSTSSGSEDWEETNVCAALRAEGLPEIELVFTPSC